MLPIKERLNNPQIVRVYRQMIENAPIDIVEQLRINLYAEAEGHAKLELLEEFFVKRLGE